MNERSDSHGGRVDLGLGLDAGGTQTRWAVAAADGSLCAQGQAPPLSGLQMASEAGRAAALTTLQGIAQAAGPVQAVVAGITGFDDRQQPQLQQLAGQALAVAPAALRLVNDIELLWHAAGPALVVDAGAGSVAAFLDADGRVQRAGGRGALIDDAGGGHWIACRALRAVWREEDRLPGAWRGSPLARALFTRIGGPDWPATRAWAYGASRGEIGTLALAVAEVADEDPAALALVQRAGAELARLVQALWQRQGPRTLEALGLAGMSRTELADWLGRGEVA